MDCDHDQPMTPEMDAAVARVAMEQHDWSHAAHHVASALASDPSRADLLELLDELVERSGLDGASLFPLEGEVWFGQAAAHARLLFDEGHWEPALDLLCQVAVTRPDAGFLVWLEDWFDADDDEVVVDPDAAHQSFTRLLGVDLPPDEAAEVLEPALAAIRRLRVHHPEHPALAGIASMLARRAGQVDEALQIARTSFERAPSWHGAVALANAARAADRWDEAEAAWGAALKLQPDDVSVRLDWADALLDRGDVAGARTLYRQVLDREPEHPWALPSALFCDFADQPSTARRWTLARWADNHPDEPRGAQLADRATAWVGWLPDPSEASVNVLPQVLEALGKGAGTITLNLSALEGPSSQLAARRAAAAAGGELKFEIGAIPSPDLRLPFLGDARFRLFRWEGTVAEPGLAPVDDDRLVDLVGWLATRPYHPERWLDQGRELAEVRNLGEGDVPALLALAVHPPPPPEGAPSWIWANRVVHAVAFLLAGMDGWAGTAHRDGLRSMLSVRNDWVAVAAAIACAERAREDDEVGAELRPLWIGILRDRPEPGGWCLGWPAALAILRAGADDDPELRDALWRLLPSYEDPPAEA